MNKKEFDKYIENFDMNNPMIKGKYYHTFRVVEYAREISLAENLNENDKYIAETAALLHDIARFKQATEYNTYIDSISFDHGLMGYKILKENNYISKYTKKKEESEIILQAVKNHNQLLIDENLSERTKFFAKIVRDADKLDIMDTQYNEITKNNQFVSEKVMKSLLNQELVLNDDAKSEADMILRMLGFIYDMEFKKSYEIIKDKKIVERKIKILKNCVKNANFDKLEETLNNYISERMKKNVG